MQRSFSRLTGLAIAGFATLLLAGTASATPVSFDLDAYIWPMGSIEDIGSFTADNETGEITAFDWDAIGSLGFGALSDDDFFLGRAYFDAGQNLLGLAVYVTDGSTRLRLHFGSANGGFVSELSFKTWTLALGYYRINEADTGDVVLSGGAGPGPTSDPVPEPTAGALYAAGLLIAGVAVRARGRRQS